MSSFKKIGVGIAAAGTLAVGGGILVNDTPVSERTLPVGYYEQVLPNEESLFAEIDPETGEVLRVIVIEAELLETGRWGDPRNFVRTYADGRARKNGAGIGYKYDQELDVFVPPKPNDLWVLDETTADWKDPSKK